MFIGYRKDYTEDIAIKITENFIELKASYTKKSIKIKIIDIIKIGYEQKIMPDYVLTLAEYPFYIVIYTQQTKYPINVNILKNPKDLIEYFNNNYESKTKNQLDLNKYEMYIYRKNFTNKVIVGSAILLLVMLFSNLIT